MQNHHNFKKATRILYLYFVPDAMMGTLSPKETYEELKTVAEKLGITVSEQNFRPTGITVRSGLCKIRGRQHFLINKHHQLRKKIDLLVEMLQDFPHDSIFVIPAIRQLLNPGDDITETATEETQVPDSLNEN